MSSRDRQSSVLRSTQKASFKSRKNPYFNGGNDVLMSGVGTCKWVDRLRHLQPQKSVCFICVSNAGITGLLRDFKNSAIIIYNNNFCFDNRISVWLILAVTLFFLTT